MEQKPTCDHWVAQSSAKVNFWPTKIQTRQHTATNPVIPDLTSHTGHWFSSQIHRCWCRHSRSRWFWLVPRFFPSASTQPLQYRASITQRPYRFPNQLQSCTWGTHTSTLRYSFPQGGSFYPGKVWDKAQLCVRVFVLLSKELVWRKGERTRKTALESVLTDFFVLISFVASCFSAMCML